MRLHIFFAAVSISIVGCETFRPSNTYLYGAEVSDEVRAVVFNAQAEQVVALAGRPVAICLLYDLGDADLGPPQPSIVSQVQVASVAVLSHREWSIERLVPWLQSLARKYSDLSRASRTGMRRRQILESFSSQAGRRSARKPGTASTSWSSMTGGGPLSMDLSDEVNRLAAAFVTKFVPSAVRNQGVGEECSGTARTQMRETMSEAVLSTRIAYPLG